MKILENNWQTAIIVSGGLATAVLTCYAINIPQKTIEDQQKTMEDQQKTMEDQQKTIEILKLKSATQGQLIENQKYMIVKHESLLLKVVKHSSNDIESDILVDTQKTINEDLLPLSKKSHELGGQIQQYEDSLIDLT